MTHFDSSGDPLPVLHVLAVSLPHLNGYTVRSRYIVETETRVGRSRPTVITSPFYPGNPAAIEAGTIAGVEHHRVPHPSDLARGEPLSPGDRACRWLFRLRRSRLALAVHRRLVWVRDGVPPGVAADGGGAVVPVPAWRSTAKSVARRLLRLRPLRLLVDRFEHWLERLEEVLLLRRFARGIERVARQTGARLIHAHSPFRSALPAIRAARALGLPVVYEVRGMWEESAVAGGRFTRGDFRYRHWRRRETRAMAGADAVIAIGEALRDEVVSRGVVPERAFVVPNAVDPERFQPLPAGAVDAAPADTALAELASRLTGTVLGYVGSVREMEGVDELVRGAAAALETGREVSVLVVGDGPQLDELAALATRLGIADRVFLPGRVPHDRVADYYRLIDVFVVSRPDRPVTRTVTPLKPLEAMAMGKALVVSDLPALREMVEHGRTGLVYRAGDPQDLARQAGRLIDGPGLLQDMGRRARRWVVEERTWDRVLETLSSVYAAAIANAGSRR